MEDVCFIITDDKASQSLLNAFYNGKFNKNFSIQLNFDYLNNKTNRKAKNMGYSFLNR